MSLQAVLMCGGLGSRLRPWSWIIPKPMFPIGERSILELLLDRLRINGISEIYISVGYKAELIEATLRDGSHLGVKIEYVRETEPLGTAGSLNLVKDKLKGPFLMMNGDLLTHLNFKRFFTFHQQHDAEITVATKRYDVQVPYGVIETDNDRIISMQEKPTYSPYINAGIYLISLTALDLLPPDGRFDATQLIQAAMDANRAVYSYPIKEYWMDIGRLEDYFRANDDAQKWMDSDDEPPQED
jgi:NDP-sugar pyrophosphorylase family protein